MLIIGAVDSSASQSFAKTSAAVSPQVFEVLSAGPVPPPPAAAPVAVLDASGSSPPLSRLRAGRDRRSRRRLGAISLAFLGTVAAAGLIVNAARQPSAAETDAPAVGSSALSAAAGPVAGSGFASADTAMLTETAAADPYAGGVMYVAVPHPDDEFQAWALFENTPDVHKVFVMLTRGEQAGYCDDPAYAEGTGEMPPVPWPQGRWTPSCVQARIGSFFGFMEAMGATDPGLPESYTPVGTVGPFADRDGVVCRIDAAAPAAGQPDSGCVVNRTAEVWTSEPATVVWFDLGDGDLTADEVRWALRTVLDSKDVLGIGADRPDIGVVGAAWWNGAGHAACDDYAHSDHGAVAAALSQFDMEAGWQAAPTCPSDLSAVVSVSVSRAGFLEAFSVVQDVRIGHFPVHYGWLAGGGHGYHHSDYHGQASHFNRHQHFWATHTDRSPLPAGKPSWPDTTRTTRTTRTS